MDELEQLQQQIAELQKKAQEVAQARRLPVLEEVRNKIKLYGFTAKELGFVESPVGVSIEAKPIKEKKPVAIKYRSGENTWTGRGMKPKWIVAHIQNGGKLEELAV